MKQIYLDYAAATPMDKRVKQAMEPFFTDNFYNPSAIYLAARNTRRQLEEARHQTAIILGARPAEIVFTAGATEANNLAIQGIMRQFQQAEVLVSSIEHESVLAPAKLFAQRQIPVDSNGRLILNKLSNLISDMTVMVSVMLINNELGTIQPLKEIAAILDSVRNQRRTNGNKLPIYLHTDAAQAGNYLDLHVRRLGVDLMSLNGGKIYGPKQSGAIYVKSGIDLIPQIVGGGQESGRRSGTENMAAIAGFSEALQIAQKMRRAEAQRIRELRQLFESQIIKLIPSAVINGSNHRAPHLTSVSFAGKDNERLMMELDEAGIMCAVGSACSASRNEVSYVLSSIGLSETEARSTLRFSLGRQTVKADIQKTIRELVRLIL